MSINSFSNLILWNCVSPRQCPNCRLAHQAQRKIRAAARSVEEGQEQQPKAKSKAKAKGKSKAKAKGRPAKTKDAVEPTASADVDVTADADLSAEEDEIRKQLAVDEMKDGKDGDEVKRTKKPRKGKSAGSKETAGSEKVMPEVPVNRNLEKDFEKVDDPRSDEVEAVATSPRNAPDKRPLEETTQIVFFQHKLSESKYRKITFHPVSPTHPIGLTIAGGCKRSSRWGSSQEACVADPGLGGWMFYHWYFKKYGILVLLSFQKPLF